MSKPRSQTFSYSSSISKPLSPDVRSHGVRNVNTNTAKDMRTGILPNFVFLQLYHMGLLHASAVPVPITDNNEVGIATLLWYVL